MDNSIPASAKLVQFAALLVVFFILCICIRPMRETVSCGACRHFWQRVPEILNNSVEFIMFEWMPIETYNVEIEDYEESALMIEITRSMSRSVLFCIEFIREILVGGQKTIVAFTSWDFVSENEWAYLARTALDRCCRSRDNAGLCTQWALARHSGGLRNDRLYLRCLGQWAPAMETLSFVLIAAPAICGTRGFPGCFGL